MVFHNSYSISEMVVQANDTPSILQIEIVYPTTDLIVVQVPFQIPIPIPSEEYYIASGIGFGNENFNYEEMYNDDYDDYPVLNLEEAYEDHIAEINARTHFIDVRKQETIDREKDNTHQKKRRATQLTKKVNKANARIETEEMYEKKRPSKKSGRRGSQCRDIVLC